MEKKNRTQEAAPTLSDEELTSQLAKYKALLVLGKLLVGAGVVVTGISLFTGMIPGVVVGILLAIIGSRKPPAPSSPGPAPTWSVRPWSLFSTT